MLSSETILTQSNPVLEFGFGFTPWESADQPDPIDAQTRTSSGSDEPVRSCSINPDALRKLRRMASNRESARRSRMRKQRHLEDLRLHASRIKAENKDLRTRLGGVAHYGLLVRRDNHRLRAESNALRLRLSEIRRFLLFQQLQPLSAPASAVLCGGFAASGSVQTGSSIIA